MRVHAIKYANIINSIAYLRALAKLFLIFLMFFCRKNKKVAIFLKKCDFLTTYIPLTPPKSNTSFGEIEKIFIFKDSVFSLILV